LKSGWFRKPIFKILLSAFLLVFIAVSGVTLHYYIYYSKMIDRRLDGEVFQRTAELYATPYHVFPGQKLKPDQVIARLQRAGFEPAGSDHVDDGTYELNKDRLTIKPAVGDTIQLRFSGEFLKSITKSKGGELQDAALPAELVTSLTDTNREKRRIVEFKELPPVLVNALIAAEDNRFYSHFGIDPIRLAGAVFQSLRKDRVRGTSTITQQLAETSSFLKLDCSTPIFEKRTRSSSHSSLSSALASSKFSRCTRMTSISEHAAHFRSKVLAKLRMPTSAKT
jgi:penicillin-binding protein 1B